MKFSKLRRKIAEHFKGDEGLFQGYQSNIACLLHDGFIEKRFTTSRKGCNDAAEEIMNLVFSIAPILKDES